MNFDVRMLVADGSADAVESARLGRMAGWTVAGPNAPLDTFNPAELAAADLVVLSSHAGFRRQPAGVWKLHGPGRTVARPADLFGDQQARGTVLALACDEPAVSPGGVWSAGAAWNEIRCDGSVFAGFGTVSHRYALRLVEAIVEGMGGSATSVEQVVEDAIAETNRQHWRYQRRQQIRRARWTVAAASGNALALAMPVSTLGAVSVAGSLGLSR